MIWSRSPANSPNSGPATVMARKWEYRNTWALLYDARCVIEKNLAGGKNAKLGFEFFFFLPFLNYEDYENKVIFQLSFSKTCSIPATKFKISNFNIDINRHNFNTASTLVQTRMETMSISALAMLS